jgi:hypothetical protein
MDMNKSITKEIIGLLKVSKHVDWGILNHYVLRAHRILWPPERHGVAKSMRNILRTTSPIGVVWMNVEVSFKPFPLRSFACQRLLIQKNQMLWGVAFLHDMHIASTGRQNHQWPGPMLNGYFHIMSYHRTTFRERLAICCMKYSCINLPSVN